jgi:N-acyl-D-amino-acid deacylase
VEQGRLQLDDKVFELLDWGKIVDDGDSFDDRLKSVTVRHLLQHRGGWDRDASFDPMFRSVQFAEAWGCPPPAGPEEIIRAMLAQRLDFDPGQRYAYSNYGYCLLGRVIETVTGQSYEGYVQHHVLRPLGIRSMLLGRTRLEHRQEGEVRYYDPGKGTSVFAEDLNQRTAPPYGAWYLEAMDSHG